MIRVEAQTLEAAYSKAAAELSCSVTELELNVIQYPKKGLFGIGKKVAIVEARRIAKNFAKNRERDFRPQNKGGNFQQQQQSKKTHQEKRAFHNDKAQSAHKKSEHKHFEKPTETKPEHKTAVTQNIAAPTEPKTEALIEPKIIKEKPKKHIDTSTPFDEQFHRQKADPAAITQEVKEKIATLFDNLCFDVTTINVSVYDEDTLLIEIDGSDAALLIGKEGCRYKALSYMFYSWINIRYGLGIRLEIAEFLKNQEEMMSRYLAPIIERIQNNGRGQTKILDGVLIKIALERLRGEFPDKYVGIKNGRDGGRFIVVNDFNRKNQ